MGHCVFMYFICTFGVFDKGLTALIQTQKEVMVAVGDEALLSCQLIEAKDVLQVTWQKSDGEKDVATYSGQFGERVNADFRDKVKFKDAGLQSSSIIIKDVTEKDEGCYRCLFNSYPEGALITTTCLKVYELHEPVLHVTESNSPEETVVSCSVTGRPAPTVTLRVLRHNVHFSHYITDSVTNTNGTVTVTTTAVLPRFHDSSTQVECAVRVPSGPQTERFVMIPEVKQTTADGFDEESGSKTGGRSDEESESNNSGFYFTFVIVPLVAACCYALVIIYVLWTRNIERRMKKTTKDDHDEVRTPLVNLENTQIRQRTPPEKNLISNSPEPSPSVARRLKFDREATSDTE